MGFFVALQYSFLLFPGHLSGLPSWGWRRDFTGPSLTVSDCYTKLSGGSFSSADIRSTFWEVFLFTRSQTWFLEGEALVRMFLLRIISHLSDF